MAPAAAAAGKKQKKKWSKGKGTIHHPPLLPLPPPPRPQLQQLQASNTDVLTLPLIVKDKANHAVVLDKATSDKLYKDVQSYRLITVATLVDRLKINGSLARKALNDLEEKGQIKKVVGHSKLSIYTRAVTAAE
ncbi:MAG: hypothetical protein Q9207_007137 [Kuettlingeria erythrocarpa]